MRPSYLPGPPTAVGLLLAAMIAVWLGLRGPIDISTIKEWQTLIGFGAVLIVACMAWAHFGRHLRRQQRAIWITLISREEERLEIEVIGFRQAERLLLSTITAATEGAKELKAMLEDEGLAADGEIKFTAIEEMLLSAPDRVRREIYVHLQLLYATSTGILNCRTEIQNHQRADQLPDRQAPIEGFENPALTGQRKHEKQFEHRLKELTKGLFHLHASFMFRREQISKRVVGFRNELERHFPTSE